MTKKRRQYTPEFKESAVKLVTEQGYKMAESSQKIFPVFLVPEYISTLNSANHHMV